MSDDEMKTPPQLPRFPIDPPRCDTTAVAMFHDGVFLTACRTVMAFEPSTQSGTPQLVPSAAVHLPWAVAVAVRDALSQCIELHEREHGKIAILTQPPMTRPN